MNEVALAALAAVVVTGLWMRGAWRRLAALRRAVASAWKQVDAVLRERADAVKPLVVALRAPLDSEHAALDAVVAAQAEVGAAADAMRGSGAAQERAEALLNAETAMTSASARMLALIDLHPAARQLPAVAAHLKTLRDVAPRLTFARQVYNEAVQVYNAALRQFPTRLLVGLFRLHPAARI